MSQVKRKTYYRFNGCGLTVSPVPGEGVHSISTKWITIFFIPLIPLGFVYIVGFGAGRFKEMGKIPVAVAWEKLPRKNFFSILLYPLMEGLFFFIGFFAIMALINHL